MAKKSTINLLHDLVDTQIPEKVITGLALDSRKIKPGDLFIALSGAKFNGADYIDEVLAKGACGVLVEDRELANSDKGIIYVNNLRSRLSYIGAKFYDFPSKNLNITGITGTDGKTSIAYLLAFLLAKLGKKSAMIGTLGHGAIDDIQNSELTTPDPISLQKYLYQLKEQKITDLAMEVSSIGLDQRRVEHVDFDYGIFTNLHQDHLDYHKTLQAYGKAKERFFHDYNMKKAIICLDDPFGAKMIQSLPTEVNCVTYGQDLEANFSVEHIDYLASGMKVKLNSPVGPLSFETNLIGKFNLLNLMAALSVLLPEYDSKRILPLLKNLPVIPGRMQSIKKSNAPRVVIDFAHTPVALQNALKACKELTSGKLWCIFGCGGERDQIKRAEMGKAAVTFSDRVTITNDNPRNELPTKIVDDILQGVDNYEYIEINLDRKEAIYKAILQADQNDLVLIAGKGHETTQIIGDEEFSFNDYKVATSALRQIN